VPASSSVHRSSGRSRDNAAIASASIPTPFGSLVLRVDATGLVDVDLGLQSPDEECRSDDALLTACIEQFERYFQHGRFEFSLPLAPLGTRYQRSVWAAMSRIPAGTTRAYGDLADDLGSGARAVASACRSNPLPIVIPCHRVVARNGLGGYCGGRTAAWLEIKRWLLKHERSGAST
jgi:methylated-DNA-[protein]-cysteine S-methyltransferase